MKRNLLNAGRFALTGVAAAALSFITLDAMALGLGRLAVQSALGESLRAEIDVTSLSAEEASNLKVRIAPPESYRAAGVDYNPVLPATQAVLLRRADGRPYLRLSSDRAVQEPFVDVILELTWSTGRLVREYTLLFDPPSNRAVAAAPAPIAPAVASPAPAPAAAPSPPSTAEPSVAAARPAERKLPAPKNAAAPTPAPAPVVEAKQAVTSGADSYQVRAGDSLSRIAARTQRAGVSLDQMLVSLYRGNPQAFVENNMNRLKSGVVLSVPAADAAKAVTTSEARQVIQAQSADFGAYRQRLASGVPETKSEGSARQATGKVQSNVEDKKQAAAVTPDKLTLSKAASSPKATAVEDKLSKEKEKKESATRVAELSRNVEELKRISGAAASAAAAPTVPAAAPAIAAAKPATPAIAAPSPVPTAPPAPAPVPVIATPPASAPVPVLKAPPAASATVVAAASVPARPTAASSVAAPRPAAPVVATQVDEPGMIASLMDDNPLALVAGGGVLAALLGFGFYRFSRRAKKDSGETSFLESRLQPDSFFGASGGQRIDTRDAGGASSSMSYSLSQLDAIGDVDPVAEADVYLAYGRDLQAEEILKEAMRGNPERLAIRTKLLEVYAKRRDIKGFELLATQLFALTRGEGEDWARAQELGEQVDPDNVLYHPGGAPLLPQGAADHHIEPLGASTMPQSVLPSPSQFGPDAAQVASAQSATMDLDLDLDLDLDFNEPASAPTQPAAFSASPAVAMFDAADGSFNLEQELPPPPAMPAPAAAPAAPLAFDLSSISLDFDTTSGSALGALDSPAALALQGAAVAEEEDQADPLERKLELAEEFRQIGDMEGARDLVQEVIAKASGGLKVRAQGMLDDLG